MILNPLKPGDRISLVAPASPFDPETFAQARDILQHNGYELSIGEHVNCKKGYLAGTEAERADDLIRALVDPEISAVLCIRGGYGSARLLPWLPFSTLKDHPKIFLGYSDITFLHLAFQSRMEWITFHSPNAMDLARMSDPAATMFGMLSGEHEFAWTLTDEQVLRHGMRSGIVVGGNLTCLIHLLGTPYFPNLEGRILLIEDRGEALYRIDRHLTHLKLAGVLQQLGGLALGHFEDCGSAPEIHNMVLEQVDSFHFPVVVDLPFGHGLHNEVVPLGMPFTLNTYEHSFKADRHPFKK